MARTLDGAGQRSLVCSAGTCDPAGKDLAALGNILAELGSILIIDLIVFSAENADFSFSMEAASLLERSIFSLKCHGLPPMY